jgi:hypothetical protein
MESVKTTLNAWPQILVVLALVFLIIGGFVRHGKPMLNPTVNGMQSLWAGLWWALVLGAGGFWHG